MHHTKPLPIRTVIFDFGGVFTDSPTALIRRSAENVGVDPDGLIDIVLGGYEVESDHPWQRVERGELAMEEARTWARLETRHRLGVELDPLEIMAPLLNVPVRQEMVDLVEEIRDNGKVVGLLTNNAAELRNQWRSLADWDSLFDQIIDTSEIGVRKPAPTAFNHALRQCGESEPARALMVDDFSMHVAGARAVGMHGVLVGEDPAKAISTIQDLVLR